jgi:hypothetical protein
MDMKRNNFKIENKNDELLRTIWEYKGKKKGRWERGEGGVLLILEPCPLGKDITFTYILSLFNLINF